MQTIKVDAFDLGNEISVAARKAKIMAIDKEAMIEFKFNERTCRIDENTNLAYFCRDFMNSYIMNWKEIGPECHPYSATLVNIIEEKKQAQEKRRQQQAEEYRRQEQIKQESLDLKLKDIELNVTDNDALASWDAANKDGYGGAIMQYAKQWGRLMQFQMQNGAQLIEIAQKASYEADTVGLTGFMYGCAVQILTKCWAHGEELRKWHNKQYHHEGDGVVNPAIMTIASK